MRKLGSTAKKKGGRTVSPLLGRSSHKASAFLLRSRLRAALPSSLVGLVTFSFVILAFGAVVYTAALPSLVAASPVVGDAQNTEAPQGDSVTDGSTSADAGDQPAELSEGDGDPAASSGENSADSNSAAGGTDSLGGLAVPGAVAGVDGGGNNEGNEDPSAASDASAANGNASAGDSPSVDAATNNNDGSSSDSHGSSSDSTADTSENDAWLLAYASEKSGELSSLQQQLTELNQTASNDFVSNESARATNAAHAEAFYSEAGGAFSTVLNQVSAHSHTSYTAAANDLVGMYRCLWNASDVLNQAWAQSAGLAGNTERLATLYNEAMAEEQNYLDQYNSYAAVFSRDLGA